MATPPLCEPGPPAEIRLSADRAALILVWADGTRHRIATPVLRANSPSAGERRLRLEGLQPPPPPDVVLVDVRLLGNYALNLVFSDGHDRGIYPWRLLRALADAQPLPLQGANAIP